MDKAANTSNPKGKLLKRKLQEWSFYWKNVGKDYKEVAIGIKQDVKQKPLKGALIFSAIGLAIYSVKTNPSAQSFRNKHLQCTNDLVSVNMSLVRESSAQHLKFIEKCYNENRLRHRSFGLFAVIYVDDRSDILGTYDNNCDYLRWKYLEFPGRVIDVGFWNTWWVISRKMLDYDVNYV